MPSALSKHFRRPLGRSTTWRIGHLIHQMTPGADFPITIPEYQRGRVWTVQQQVDFIRFLVTGGRCPAFYIRETILGDEVIDGYQRLNAIKAFVSEGLVVDVKGDAVTYKDAELEVQRFFRSVTVPIIALDDYISDNDERELQAMELYLAINAKGTPHTAEDLQKVRDCITRKQEAMKAKE